MGAGVLWCGRKNLGLRSGRYCSLRSTPAWSRSAVPMGALFVDVAAEGDGDFKDGDLAVLTDVDNAVIRVC
jgi:hypothetical protein